MEGSKSINRIISDEQIGKWVCDKIGSEWFKEGTYCIGEVNSTILSGAIFEKFNGASVMVTLATIKSFSREFINTIHNVAFDVLKVNCVVCQASSSNKKSQRLLNHLGFKQIGTIPKAMIDGDMLIFALSRSDRKYGANYGKRS
jgi:RimJ/RimL family protein N-acetyltransferase